MLVVSSRYTRPLEEVDRLREAHLGWVGAHVEAGRVLLSGRRTPPDGRDPAAVGRRARTRSRPSSRRTRTCSAASPSTTAVGEFTPGLAGPGLEALLG